MISAIEYQIEPEATDVAAVLDGAIDLLVTDGWCQGQYRGHHGERCLSMALFDAVRSHLGIAQTRVRDVEGAALWGEAGVAVAQAVRTRAHHLIGIVTFNDEVAETVEDVIMVLKEAREAVSGGGV